MANITSPYVSNNKVTPRVTLQSVTGNVTKVKMPKFLENIEMSMTKTMKPGR